MRKALRDRIKQAEEMLATNQVVEDSRPDSLVFRKIGTSDCYMRYVLLSGSTLVVVGDLGDAVYQWHGDPRLTFQWLAGLDLDYFVSKCRASEVGVPFEEWSEEIARERFADLRKSYAEHDPERVALLDKIIEETHGVPFDNRGAWNAYADTELRQVWEDLDGVFDIGQTIAYLAVCHWTGLRLAFPESRK